MNSPKLTPQQVIDELRVMSKDASGELKGLYKAAIYYIERADDTLPSYDRLSFYARRTDI